MYADDINLIIGNFVKVKELPVKLRVIGGLSYGLGINNTKTNVLDRRNLIIMDKNVCPSMK